MWLKSRARRQNSALLPTQLCSLAAVLLTASTAQWAVPCFATLGERASSVQADRHVMRGVLRTQSLPQYRVSEIKGANTVRQYIDSNDIVFAVTWRGLSHPDPDQLLGQYWPGLRVQHQVHRRREPALHLKSSAVPGSEVVYETWGHMGDVQGRAYLPRLVPQGIQIEDLE